MKFIRISLALMLIHTVLFMVLGMNPLGILLLFVIDYPVWAWFPVWFCYPLSLCNHLSLMIGVPKDASAILAFLVGGAIQWGIIGLLVKGFGYLLWYALYGLSLLISGTEWR
jgi:hypothetical protein